MDAPETGPKTSARVLVSPAVLAIVCALTVAAATGLFVAFSVIPDLQFDAAQAAENDDVGLESVGPGETMKTAGQASPKRTPESSRPGQTKPPDARPASE